MICASARSSTDSARHSRTYRRRPNGQMRAWLARRMRSSRGRLGELKQARDLGVDVQAPAGALIEPGAQLGGVPPHEPEHVGVRAVAEQRPAQQHPRGARQVALAGLLERRVERFAHAASLRPVAARSTTWSTWSGAWKTPASVRISTGAPPGTGASRISSDPSPVVVWISRSPGRQAESASPSSARNSEKAFGSRWPRSLRRIGCSVTSRVRAAAVWSASAAARAASSRRW